MEVDIIISLAIAAVVLFLIAQASRIIRSIAMHKTLRKGIEHGQTLSPELVEQLDRAPAPGDVDRRIAYVLIALALSLFAAAAIAANPGDLKDIVAIALFPLFVGIALLLRLRIAARRGAE